MTYYDANDVLSGNIDNLTRNAKTGVKNADFLKKEKKKEKNNKITVNFSKGRCCIIFVESCLS